jgi:SWI/SNF-related matrix-associated actin-dependent regulator 1 of chromatin subfamily A
MSIEIITPHNVSVTFDFDEEQITNILTTLPSVELKFKNEIEIPIVDLASLYTILPECEKVPSKIIQCIQSQNEKNEKKVVYTTSIESSSFDYQKEGIRIGVEDMNGRLLLADDMGLGKTLQSIGIAENFFGNINKKLLIICPSSLSGNWKNELCQWSSISKKNVQVIEKDSDEIKPTSECIIISYTLASENAKRDKFNELMNCTFDCVIIDESHRLKDPSTHVSKSVAKIAKIIRHVILISGTPELSKPSELFVQLSILYPGVFTDYYEYTKRYCNGFFDQYDKWNDTGTSRVNELRLILNKIMIRRLKRDVNMLLPSKKRSIINLEMSPEHILQFGKLQKEMQKLHVECREKKSMRIINQMKQMKMKMWRETCIVKRHVVSGHILEKYKEWNTGHMLVFFHHEVMRDAIVKMCQDNTIEYIVIDGKTKQSLRNDLVKNLNTFHEGDKVKIGILSMTACSVGLNFSPGSTLAIFAELHWTPGICSQCEDRIHRVGAKKDVFIEYLIANKTVDPDIYAKLKSKFNVNDMIIDGGKYEGEFSMTSSKKFKLTT